MSAWAWLLGAANQHGSRVSPRACVWAFRVAGVGNRGSVREALEGGMAFRRRGEWWMMREEDGGRACRVAGVGLRMHVGVWEDAGRWIRLAGVGVRACRVAGVGMVAIGGAARVLSRGRRGDSCTQRAFRVASAGNGVTCCVAGHRFAWQVQGIARRAAAETVGVRGPVRENVCACVSGCVRRREIVAGAGNPLICGC